MNQDGRKKLFIDKAVFLKFLMALLLGAILLLSIILFYRHQHALAELTNSKVTCTYLEGRGIENIPQSSPYYQKHLDRNNNGIACQKEG